jgi:H+/Cl- antiporter ClcA
MARWLIITGIIFIITGLILYFAPEIFSWFGKLPGDIKIEKENSKIYIPVTTMIVISIILTIIVNILRFLKK